MKNRAPFRVGEPQSAHVVGIGGKGLAGIAEVLAAAGWRVSGSDGRESATLTRLGGQGVETRLGHDARHLPLDADVVVASAAVPRDNPEVASARAVGVPVIDRAEFLGELFAGFPLRVAVAGTHGKSTTAALLGLALERAGLAPTVFGGAPCAEKGGAHGWRGGDEVAVVEACEYRRSFLSLPADVTVVASFEHAHPECYGTPEQMGEAYAEFFAAHDPAATLVVDADSPALLELARRSGRRHVAVGFSSRADYRVVSGASLGAGASRRESCAVFRGDGSSLGSFATSLPGRCNQKNVAYVAAVLDLLGRSPAPLGETLETFRGVGRRFDARETAAGVVLVDDFAHHPSQAAHAVASARDRWPERELMVIFEPRQCRLVRRFLAEYGAAFRGAREVVVTDPVPALGDTPEDVAALPADSVVAAVSRGSRAVARRAESYAAAASEARRFVERVGRSRAAVATVGAGDICRVRDLLAEAYSC